MAGRQISIEAALDAYRDSATDLYHENVLLRARLKEVETELERLNGQAAAGPAEMPPAGREAQA